MKERRNCIFVEFWVFNFAFLFPRADRESRRSRRIGNVNNKISGHPTAMASSDVGNDPVSFGNLDKELEMTAPDRVITVAAKEKGSSATVHSGESRHPPRLLLVLGFARTTSGCNCPLPVVCRE